MCTRCMEGGREREMGLSHKMTQGLRHGVMKVSWNRPTNYDLAPGFDPRQCQRVRTMYMGHTVQRGTIGPEPNIERRSQRIFSAIGVRCSNLAQSGLCKVRWESRMSHMPKNSQGGASLARWSSHHCSSQTKGPKKEAIARNSPSSPVRVGCAP
jgi:hypothetical protein